jgi:hypothetical protein
VKAIDCLLYQGNSTIIRTQPHKLGLFEKLGRNLKTKSGIENRIGQVRRHVGKVERWHHSPQWHQWMPLSLFEAEFRMRRIIGYEDLPELKEAVREATSDED